MIVIECTVITINIWFIVGIWRIYWHFTELDHYCGNDNNVAEDEIPQWLYHSLKNILTYLYAVTKENLLILLVHSKLFNQLYFVQVLEIELTNIFMCILLKKHQLTLGQLLASYQPSSHSKFHLYHSPLSPPENKKINFFHIQYQYLSWYTWTVRMTSIWQWE